MARQVYIQGVSMGYAVVFCLTVHAFSWAAVLVGANEDIQGRSYRKFKRHRLSEPHKTERLKWAKQFLTKIGIQKYRIEGK